MSPLSLAPQHPQWEQSQCRGAHLWDDPVSRQVSGCLFSRARPSGMSVQFPKQSDPQNLRNASVSPGAGCQAPSRLSVPADHSVHWLWSTTVGPECLPNGERWLLGCCSSPGAGSWREELCVISHFSFLSSHPPHPSSVPVLAVSFHTLPSILGALQTLFLLPGAPSPTSLSGGCSLFKIKLWC